MVQTTCMIERKLIHMAASLGNLASSSSSEKNINFDHSKTLSKDAIFSSAESSCLDLMEFVKEHKKGFKCKICGKIFATKYSAVRHINTVHFLERLFCCPFCKAGFKQKTHLNRHVQISCRMKKSNA